MTYTMCKKLIDNNRYEYEDMLNKIDTFLLADRITDAQYTELKGLMDKKLVV